ncbi:MAG TPA: hypothetical protein VFX76_09800, partial [Roseiflexaceae bacterium]|nr:hypothetical protein [Roseiflexaceae bacterium]
VRILITLLGVVAISVLIGLASGRPFESPDSSAARATAQSSPGPAVSATPRPSPAPTLAPSPTSAPVSPTPDDGWLIQSRETFDEVSTWPAKAEAGWASGYTDGRYWLRLSGQQTISYRVPIDGKEFRITVDVQVKNGYAGLVFLASEAGELYRFQVDGAGKYRLGKRQGSTFTPLIDWTASPALKPGTDAVNQIEIRRVQDELQLYANNTLLTTTPVPSDTTLSAQVGMTLDALARDQVAEAFFDNLVVRLPFAPSGQ